MPLKSYPTERVYEVVLHKPISVQISQIVLFVSNNRGYFNEFVGESTVANDFINKLYVR